MHGTNTKFSSESERERKRNFSPVFPSSFDSICNVSTAKKPAVLTTVHDTKMMMMMMLTQLLFHFLQLSFSLSMSICVYLYFLSSRFIDLSSFAFTFLDGHSSTPGSSHMFPFCKRETEWKEVKKILTKKFVFVFISLLLRCYKIFGDSAMYFVQVKR